MHNVDNILYGGNLWEEAQLGASLMSPSREGPVPREITMCNTTATYTVAGMTCNSCVNKVTNAVTGIDGIEDVDVDVATGTLEVSGHVDDAAVRAAVNEAGYQIVG